MDNQDNTSELQGVAIIGMSGRFPGARDIAEFWRNLCGGVESILAWTDQELTDAGIDPLLLSSPNYVKAGSFIEDAAFFDASFFGYSPREAEIIDPQQRIFLECAWEALEHSGYQPDKHSHLVGVYAGASLSRYLQYVLSNRDLKQMTDGLEIMFGNDKDFLATRVCYQLNLNGPGVSIQTACSTSLVAVHLACHDLLTYQCDMALAGGVSIQSYTKCGYVYREGGIASPDGHCRPFDSGANGTVGGSGVGIVVLKRFEDAIADRDTIYAVIKGSAINNDGRDKVGFTAPSRDGQAQVIHEALACAGVSAETISYVEAHGTATNLGDPIEVAALTQAFRHDTEKRGYCGLGSVKSNIGHLDAAAGVAGLIKTTLALSHGLLPPSLNLESLNPIIDFENSPFYVNSKLSPWDTDSFPRRAGVSSFGIGGTNAHLIVEEPPVRRTDIDTPDSWQLIVLSARTETALAAAAMRLTDHLSSNHPLQLPDIAHTLQVGRKAFNHRQFIISRNTSELIKALSMRDEDRVFTGFHNTKCPSVVFMFPGQGAQHAGMAQDLYASEPLFREHMDHCCSVLQQYVDFDLRAILFKNGEPARQIDHTELAQPALFIIEYALANLWMELGITPDVMIGHSLGEYVAACLAGVFSLEDALYLVASRARLMQLLTPGAMLSVTLPESEIRGLLGEELSLAAVNGPSSCVVSGRIEAIETLEKRFNQDNVHFRRLNTSHAFHSGMMTPILEEFTNNIRRINLNPPKIPYISGVTGTWITAADATDPEYWTRQLRNTVHFSAGLQEIAKDPAAIFLEVGPGQSLAALARRQLGSRAGPSVMCSLPRHDSQDSDAYTFLTGLGRIWLTGHAVNWSKHSDRTDRYRIPLPTYPFERQRYWVESAGSSARQDITMKDSEQRLDIRHWTYVPSWSRLSLGLNNRINRDGQRSPLLLFETAANIGSRLLHKGEFVERNIITIVPGESYRKIRDDLFEINPGRLSDYKMLIRNIPSCTNQPLKIIHLWSDIGGGVDTGAFAAGSRDFIGFYSLVYLSKAIDNALITENVELNVITKKLFDVIGTEHLSPETGTVIGPCRVIPQEYPNITCRLIDMDDTSVDDDDLEVLTRELESSVTDMVIAHRNGCRWVQRYEPTQIDMSLGLGGRLRNNGTYIITGGLGKIGLSIAEFLSTEVQGNIILVGRSDFPERPEWKQWMDGQRDDEIREKIQRLLALEANGSTVSVIRADVGDVEEMRSAVQSVCMRFGGIHGVFHCAGVAGKSAAKTIRELSDFDCEEQFRSKIRGVRVMDEVIPTACLDFCVLASSLSSILGGLGFSAYAAANSFMDLFAQSKRASNTTQWISVNLDGWSFDGPTNTAFDRLNKLAIIPSDTTALFAGILCTNGVPQIAVSTTDLQARLRRWVLRQDAAPIKPKTSERSVSHPRPRLNTDYVEPGSDLEARIVQIMQSALGIERVGIDDNFFELGGDSLIATVIISRLKESLRISVPLRLLLESPTVKILAANIESIEWATQGPDGTGNAGEIGEI